MSFNKSDLTEKQLLILQSEMAIKKRSTGIAYLIFCFLPIGLIGGHHWYLRNYVRALAYPFFGLLTFALVSSDKSNNAAMWFLVSYFGLIFLDFCSLAFQVGLANRRFEKKIIKSILKETMTLDTKLKAAQ